MTKADLEIELIKIKLNLEKIRTINNGNAPAYTKELKINEILEND